jgi:hypothetical protein
MFESVVASQLNKYLGRYIHNLDTENLNIGIWNGELSFMLMYDVSRIHPLQGRSN